MAKPPFFDRLWYGPLLVLPWQERQKVLHDIQKARVVTGPRHRGLTFEYVSTRLRRSRWLTLAVAVIFVGDVSLAVAASSLHSLGPALSSLSMIFIGFAPVTAWRQNRRFLLRNSGPTAMAGTEQLGS